MANYKRLMIILREGILQMLGDFGKTLLMFLGMVAFYLMIWGVLSVMVAHIEVTLILLGVAFITPLILGWVYEREERRKKDDENDA